MRRRRRRMWIRRRRHGPGFSIAMQNYFTRIVEEQTTPGCADLIIFETVNSSPGISQSLRSRHKSWRKIFAWNENDATIPGESLMDKTILRIRLRVLAGSWGLRRMVKELVSVCQATLQVHVQSEGRFHPLDLLRIGRTLDLEYVVELFWSC